jgi:membrane protein required for colicin V production
VGGVIDAAALAVLGLAILRGLWIGIVREAFSIAALAAAIFAFRALRAPVADAIAMRTHWDPLITAAVAGGAVVVAAMLGVAIVGAIVRRVVNTVGLSFVDRIGGAVIGAAEGILVIGLALFGATQVLGTRDPLFANSRAVAIFQSYVGREDHSARRDAVERAEAARKAGRASDRAPESGR